MQLVLLCKCIDLITDLLHTTLIYFAQNFILPFSTKTKK